MNSEAIRKAVEEKFGEPDYIQKFGHGQVVEELFYYYPKAEEELFDTTIVTVGLSNRLPSNCAKTEVVINIKTNRRETEWIKSGDELENSLSNYLGKNKCINANLIAYDLSIPFFETIQHAAFINHGFLTPEFLMPGIQLLELIPLYKEEADELAKMDKELVPKILNLLKGNWSDPERQVIPIVENAVKKIWERIEAWYEKNTPTLREQLKKGATLEEIKNLESGIKVKLPADLAASLLLHNGEMSFHSYQYLSVDMISRVSIMMNELKGEKSFNSYTISKKNENFISSNWWNEKWIPFAKDSEGNLICIDTAPGKDGRYGQIVYWERVEGPLISKFKSFLDWLLSYMEGLYNNQYKVSDDGYIME